MADTLIVILRSTTSLLMNNPASMQQPGPKTRAQRIPAPEEEAEAKTYRLADGRLAFPTLAVRSYKIGRRGAKQVLAGAILDVTCPDIEGEWLLLTDHGGGPLTGYEIDVRRCVVQGNGVLRARPRLDEWQTRVAIRYDAGFTSEADILTFLKRAGVTVGLGDFRPQKNGIFGRFEVIA